MNFDLGIVLINYNSAAYTLNCIASIIEHTSPSIKMQIIVVDNASQAKDFDRLKTGFEAIEYPNLKLVESKINTGFGGGNMLGYQYIDANYVAFINNDSILKNDCLGILKKFLEQHPEAGICGPKAFLENGKLLPTLDHFSSVGKVIFKRRTLELINPKKYPDRTKAYTKPTRGQFISGSFMMLRTEDFNAIGGFDTNIFLYHEETDLCKRLQRIGKFAYLVPEAMFIHYHGVSTQPSIGIKQELKLSLMYVVRKHYGFLHWAILLVYFQISYLFKSLFKPKYWTLFFTFLKGASLANSLRHKKNLRA